MAAGNGRLPGTENGDRSTSLVAIAITGVVPRCLLFAFVAERLALDLLDNFTALVDIMPERTLFHMADFRLLLLGLLGDRYGRLFG